MAKSERNSAIELLRILALIGILWMHESISGTETTLGAWMRIGIDSFANTGVTIFILISGFYGIRRSAKKLIPLWFMLAFYSYAGLLIRIWLQGTEGLGLEELGRYMLPIIGRSGWFFTCYFLLALMSPWINRLADGLALHELRNLLILLVLIFDVSTTIFFYDFTLDGGKGIVNMVLIYLVGRYLRKRQDQGVPGKRRIIYFRRILIFFTIDFVLNAAVHLVTGGVYDKFARDNVVFILFEAIYIFLFVKSFHWKNTVVNKVATKVPAVFKMEATVKLLIATFAWDYTALRLSPAYQFVALGLSMLIVLIGFVIESIRLVVFKGMENKMTEWICKLATPIWNKAKHAIEKI